MASKTKEVVVPAPAIQVGSEVKAMCRGCKRATAHRVVAKIGWKPTRVECCTCSSVHEFRPPRVATRKPLTVEQLAEVDPGELWRLVMKRSKGTARPYDRREGYVVGSRLSHSKFGEGVVIRCASRTVCEVVFETRTAKLLMGAAHSTPDRSPRP